MVRPSSRLFLMSLPLVPLRGEKVQRVQTGVIRHRVQGRRERERHRYEEGTYRFVHSGVEWGSLPIVGMIIFEF